MTPTDEARGVAEEICGCLVCERPDEDKVKRIEAYADQRVRAEREAVLALVERAMPAGGYCLGYEGCDDKIAEDIVDALKARSAETAGGG